MPDNFFNAELQPGQAPVAEYLTRQGINPYAAEWLHPDGSGNYEQIMGVHVGFFRRSGNEVDDILLAGIATYDRDNDEAFIDKSKPNNYTTLVYTPAEWNAFVDGVKHNEFDQIAAGKGVCIVRDSKDPDGPILAFPKDLYRAFLQKVKQSLYDLPNPR